MLFAWNELRLLHLLFLGFQERKFKSKMLPGKREKTSCREQSKKVKITSTKVTIDQVDLLLNIYKILKA